MNSNVGKGAFVLVLSGLVCKLLGALFRLPLTNVISIQGIGSFQIIMSAYSLLLVFISGGTSSALSKLISSSRASGNKNKIGAFIKSATIFSLTAGLVLGFIFALLAKVIASAQGIENQSISYFLFVLLLPAGAGVALFRGVIQGYENMVPTAISQVIEQTVKFVFGLAFAFLFQKWNGQGVFGAFVGILLSEVVAFIYLFVCFKKETACLKFKSLPVRKEFFSASIPLTFSSSIVPLTTAIEAFCIVFLLSLSGITKEIATTLYGIQSGIVGVILHFPLIISLSVGMAILPNISFLSTQNDITKQKSVISRAFCIMWFFLIPLTLGITSVTKEVLPLIYPSLTLKTVNIAYNLMILGAVSTIFSAIMQFFVSILQAKGLFNQYLLYSIVGGVAKLVFLFIFARFSWIGIYAIPISNIFLTSIVSILSIIKLEKMIEIDFFEILLPIFSSILMFFCVKIILFYFTGISGLIFAVILGVIIYFSASYPLTMNIFNNFIRKNKIKEKNI